MEIFLCKDKCLSKYVVAVVCHIILINDCNLTQNLWKECRNCMSMKLPLLYFTHAFYYWLHGERICINTSLVKRHFVNVQNNFCEFFHGKYFFNVSSFSAKLLKRLMPFYIMNILQYSKNIRLSFLLLEKRTK